MHVCMLFSSVFYCAQDDDDHVDHSSQGKAINFFVRGGKCVWKENRIHFNKFGCYVQRTSMQILQLHLIYNYFHNKTHVFHSLAGQAY